MSLRFSFLVVVALLSATVPALAQRGARLRQHESEAGRYRVKFPDRERPETDTKELALGTGGQTVTVTTERVEGPKDAVFAVTFADYPETYRRVPAKAVLDGVRDGLKGTDGKIVTDKEVFLGDGPDKLAGREFYIVAGRRVIHARVFLNGTRLYQVIVTGTKERFPSETVQEFFNSFELVK